MLFHARAEIRGRNEPNNIKGLNNLAPLFLSSALLKYPSCGDHAVCQSVDREVGRLADLSVDNELPVPSRRHGREPGDELHLYEPHTVVLNAWAAASAQFDWGNDLLQG